MLFAKQKKEYSIGDKANTQISQLSVSFTHKQSSRTIEASRQNNAN